MSEALTVIERNNLVELEETIQKHLSAFYKVGFALMQIRDNKLYREKYGTFEEYCKEKWGLERRRAYQLIDGYKISENVYPGTQKPPLQEKVLRPLTIIKDPEEQREVYQKAVETAPEGKVTARHVENTVKQIVPKVDKQKNIRAEPELMSNEFRSALESMQRVLYNERETHWKTTSREVAGKYINQLLRII